MSVLQFIWRSLRFYWRSHLATLGATATAAAALTGALVVGDSVRATLRQKALNRVADACYAVTSGDRFFRQELRAIAPESAPLLMLPGAVEHESGKARANQVQIIGIDESYTGSRQEPPAAPSGNEAWLSQALAAQLGAATGDEVVLRVQKPRLFAGDAALSSKRQQSFGWRVRVSGILNPEHGGDLHLRGSGAEALNIFVGLEALADQAGLRGKANVLLVGGRTPGTERVAADRCETDTSLEQLKEALRKQWTLEDASLALADAGGTWQLRSPQVFIDERVAQAAVKTGTPTVPVLTYLANLIQHGTNATPYSMVTAAGPPYTPETMTTNEILISDWLARDLSASVGAWVNVVFFVPDSGGTLRQETNRFRVAGIVSGGCYADKSLMPDFPGIEDAETAHDWDAGFPLKYDIRAKDEDYWRQYRGTPKAFVTPACGQQLWANRFGSITAIRLPGVKTPAEARQLATALLGNLEPETMGFSFRAVRKEALEAASQAQDFGQLFLAFSIFIVFAAITLMGLVFQLGLESRLDEPALLAALGFTPARIRLFFSGEAAALALGGSFLGAVAGVAYAAALIWGLSTIWSGAVGGMALKLHAAPATLLVGAVSSALICLGAMWLVLRSSGRKAIEELLRRNITLRPPAKASRWGVAVSALCLVMASAVVCWAAFVPEPNPDAFFGAGWLLLFSGWAAAWSMLTRVGGETLASLSLRKVALRLAGRKPKRSLAVVALLSAGCFVTIAVSAFHLGISTGGDARASGTGGFDLMASSAIPLLENPETQAGRRALGLENLPEDVRIVAFRVKDGDEASCLNLNRARSPRLLAVNPGLLEGRFTFVAAAKGLQATEGWKLLDTSHPGVSAAPIEISAIGDANSIRWSMGKGLGESIVYRDGHGSETPVRIVGAVANSILQGSLMVNEQEFLSAFPETEGRRFFLVETGGHDPNSIAEVLSQTLEDYGLEVVSTRRRLAAFSGVQNTYLSTFQLLGGLGLLLGSVGVGLLVFRNVMEQRGELAMLSAVGFRKGRLVRLVFVEHGMLLGTGLLCGVIAALVAILPQLAKRGIAWSTLLAFAALAFVNGMFWTWLATRLALRGRLDDALRNE